MKTIMINLFGGPGTGKSSTAAGVFSKLKQNGINAELVTEFAKDKIWEESYKVLNNQFYITAKQYHRIARVHGKVRVIVTDSPFVIGLAYDKNKNELFRKFIVAEFNKFKNLNIFLKRDKEYSPIGRIQTEKQAKALDKRIKNMLIKNKIYFTEILANEGIIDTIVDIVKEEII